MNPRFRSQARQSYFPIPRKYLAWGGFACIVVFFMFYRSDDSFKTRVDSAAASIEHTVQKDLSISRTRLLQQIHDWNARAQMQGLHSQQIHIGDHVDLAVKSGSTSGSMASTSTNSATTCACEKAPPDPKWKMKTAKEVEVEAPELAAALKKSAVNNEVMLALGEARDDRPLAVIELHICTDVCRIFFSQA